MKREVDSLKHWVPYKLIEKEDQVFCEWLFVGDKAFEEPFFDETIRICKRLPENRAGEKNLSPLSSLTEWSENIEAVPPAVFIFHVSRCGSTMVSQLLCTCQDFIVLSEVPFLDEVLRLPVKYGYDNARLFTKALKFYSRKRVGSEKCVFIKLDSWHILFYKEIRTLFPHVPFILLYRSPDEVVRSLNKHAGIHCIPQIIDPILFGINEPVITSSDFYNYPIRVIEKFLQAYVEVMEKDLNVFLLNYHQGFIPIIEAIGRIAGITFSGNEWHQMKERLVFHSKYPGMYFSEEPITHNPDEKFNKLFELYYQLEKFRTAKPE